MLFFLCFLNTIPNEFMNLANQAKTKMKTRISKEHREDVYTRGQHKFPGIEFFLTTNLIGDSSKGVKGYSISKFNLSQSSTKKSNLYQYSNYFDENIQKAIKRGNTTIGFLAIIANRKKVLSEQSQTPLTQNSNFAFVDPKDGEILKLQTLIADDGEVQIYTIKHVETLRTFSKIRMYSTKPNKRPSKPTTNNEEEEGSDEFCGLSIGFSSKDPSTDMSTIFMGFRYYWEKPTT